jgi:hypothetical protein
MTQEAEQFAIEITDKCKTHQEWVAVVNFGLATLLQNQTLLIEIIVREAMRQIDRKKATSFPIADEVSLIFAELGLHLSVTEKKGK